MPTDHTNPTSMPDSAAVAAREPSHNPPSADPRRMLTGYYQSRNLLRRGICLINAGQYEQAAEAFADADRTNPGSRSLPALLAACHIGEGRFASAARQFAELAAEDPDDVSTAVRQALSLWQASRQKEAVSRLREALATHPDSAELHFQLGTLLAGLDELGEAEMRFTQAVAIDKNHTEALVSLALCCATRQTPTKAIRHLERAQRRRPHDARIGLLLSQAAKSLAEQGLALDMQAQVPSAEHAEGADAIEQLSRIIEDQPDFVDAFLELPTVEASGDIDGEVYALLAETLNLALDRCPNRAALHCASGRVLDCLGRWDEAVAATERAVVLDPKLVQALIQLARLYEHTDRYSDAMDRLEQAIQQGGRYADVYYLLGNLYRRNGELQRARQAYDQALEINGSYEAARRALGELAA